MVKVPVSAEYTHRNITGEGSRAKGATAKSEV
jgi:hypothetical protein